MRITANDIDNKEFKKSIRGYSANEVDDFLEQVAEDYEELYKENSLLKEKLTINEEKVGHYKKMEESIQNTLLLAQNAAEEAKRASQREADMIIKNANDAAKRIIDKADNDVIKINDEYEKLKSEFNKFRTKFRNFMNSQMEMFEALENDYNKSYSIGNNIKDIYAKEEKVVVLENEAMNKVEEVALEEQHTMEFDLSQLSNNKLNEFEDIENIKTFFAE